MYMNYRPIRRSLREEYSDAEIKAIMGRKFVAELQQLDPSILKKAIEKYRDTIETEPWNADPKTLTHEYVLSVGGWSLNSFDNIDDAIAAVDAYNNKKPAAVLVFLRGKTAEGTGFVRDFEIYSNSASGQAADKEKVRSSRADGTLEGAVRSMPSYLKKYYRKLKDKVDEKDLVTYLASADAEEQELDDEEIYDWSSARGIQEIINDIKLFKDALDDSEYDDYLQWALDGWKNN